MTREEKAVIIDELSQKFANTPYFYITNAAGMSVSEVDSLRRLCFERGVEYRVVKNTLIKKALETLDTDYSSFDEVLKGFSGVMFHPESGKVPAQLIKEFKKKSSSLAGLQLQMQIWGLMNAVVQVGPVCSPRCGLSRRYHSPRTLTRMCAVCQDTSVQCLRCASHGSICPRTHRCCPESQCSCCIR